MRNIAVFLLCLVLPVTGYSQVEGTGLEKENWRELHIVTGELSAHAKEIGLTGSRILTRVELRLRSAGIKPRDVEDPFLGVTIGAVNHGFSIELAMYRMAEYKVGEKVYRNWATKAWTANNTGTHGGSASYIIDTLDSMLDKFFNEYLKTNQE